MEFGDQSVTLVQIVQKFCGRTWGDGFASPTPAEGCHAALSSESPRKCFQTIPTCPVPEDFDGDGTLTLTFGRDQVGLQKHYGFVIPSLIECKVVPGQINLGAMDRNASALGRREVVTLTFKDHAYSDLLVDKYRLERETGEASFGSPTETIIPIASGTFWGKFLARNTFHSGYLLRVYQGTMGDALEDMRVGHYVIDRIDGPSDGKVRIIAKDFFSLIEKQKAVAPTASQGRLAAGIAAGAASFTVLPAGVGNDQYDSAGYVAIGSEVKQYTRSGDVFTVVQAGALDTDAAAHDEDDLVQQVLTFTAQRPHNIIYELLCRFTTLGTGGSPTESAYINKSAWDAAASTVTQLFTGRIAKPEAVADLVAEICEQAGLSVWPNVSTGMIELRALRAGAVSPSVTDERWILADSIDIVSRIDQRVSQVHVYYGQKDPTQDLPEPKNFHSRLVAIDADAEDAVQYGVPSIRNVYSRWIPQFGRQAAENCRDRILAMHRDAPVEVTFTIPITKFGELELARYFSLETFDLQDEVGAVRPIALATTALEHSENEIGVTAQSVRFPEVPSEGSPTVDLRQIFIENDCENINIRTIHDSLFDTPTGDEIVEVYVLEGVTVGSTSTSVAALKRGSWPAGVQITIYNSGRIQGKGGACGTAGYTSSGHLVVAATAGSNGGPALDCSEGATYVDNTDGQIWGGGGGGGGGGGRTVHINPSKLAGHGGGGSGTTGGSGASGSIDGISGGTASNPGTSTAGGLGGDRGAAYWFNGGYDPLFDVYALVGNGGDGGDPGEDGDAGENAGSGAAAIDEVYFGPGGTFYQLAFAGVGAAGGTKGAYIIGNANVVWIANGDRRGSVS